MQNAVLLLPFTVYFMHFDEVFVGKKGHRSIREAYAKPGSLIADFRTLFDCVPEREHADWLIAAAPEVTSPVVFCCLIEVNDVTCSALSLYKP